MADQIQARAEQILDALTGGGRAAVTVRSKASGQHVSLVFSVRQRREGGQKFIPRNTAEGRVGIAAAREVKGSVIEVRDTAAEYPDNYVGRFYLDSGEFREGREADPIRAWAANRIFEFALSGVDRITNQAEVLISVECSHCGRELQDPESIERLVGPECWGKHTGSKVVPQTKPEPTPDPKPAGRPTIAELAAKIEGPPAEAPSFDGWPAHAIAREAAVMISGGAYEPPER